jgi:hypothetical protein
MYFRWIESQYTFGLSPVGHVAMPKPITMRYDNSDHDTNNGTKIIITHWNPSKYKVSEWLLFNANSAIFQLYHGENKLFFNEMMMRSTLYWTNTPTWIFIGLAHHWNNCPRVDMLLHSDTLFWFRASQSLLFLLNAACLAEKQQLNKYQIYSLWIDPIRAQIQDLPHSRRAR